MSSYFEMGRGAEDRATQQSIHEREQLLSALHKIWLNNARATPGAKNEHVPYDWATEENCDGSLLIMTSQEGSPAKNSPAAAEILGPMITALLSSGIETKQQSSLTYRVRKLFSR